MKSWRKWGWRGDVCSCVCERLFSCSGLHSPMQLSAFLLKTKKDLKAEKFLHWQPMTSSATPAFTVWTNSYLFIRFPLQPPWLTNANKYLTVLPLFIAATHPDKTTYTCFVLFFFKLEQLWEMQWMQQPPTGNNMQLTQSFALAKLVIYFVKATENCPPRVER